MQNGNESEQGGEKEVEVTNMKTVSDYREACLKLLKKKYPKLKLDKLCLRLNAKFNNKSRAWGLEDIRIYALIHSDLVREIGEYED